MVHEQVILGNPPSKSNQYKIVTVKGHGTLAKTKSLKEYEKSFFLQCGTYRNRNIKGFFEFYIDVYFSSNRPDLDNALKCTMDSLQACKAITNDRNCVKIVANKFIDPIKPRIEFTIKEIDGVEVHPSTEPTLFD